MQRFGRIFAMIGVAIMVMVTAVDVAEARRAGGGGFGSRGTRTFSPPPATRTAPTQTAPIDRTMTQKPAGQQTPGATQQATGANRPAAQRPGMFGGLAGGLLGGLMLGGLIGMLMGNGLGGAAGFLGLLLQAGLIIGAIMLAMRFFGRGSQPALGGAGAPAPRASETGSTGSGMPSFSIPRIGSGLGAGLGAGLGGGLGGSGGRPAASQQADEIGVRQEDLEQFERMLKDVQAAYGAEDYATLRKLTTPEAMSWLAEELSDNATSGVKNEVRDVHLVQGDVAESWREDDGTEYATVAMRYESIDVMRDRATGKLVSGDPDNLTESVEVWTFQRKPRGDWQVSAIQGTEAA
ncbi:Tim44 domain-containing protein [Mycoplana ramosa]|uniref:Tim44 domain-containing protein n=1 Tax=Mycoplana ramosa TaxID=40837 RepID=A0ABW3YWM9_MYCRA